MVLLSNFQQVLNYRPLFAEFESVQLISQIMHAWMSNGPLYIVGQIEAMCNTTIIDDTLLEEDENFQLVLSFPSQNAIIGDQNTALVMIENRACRCQSRNIFVNL